MKKVYVEPTLEKREDIVEITEQSPTISNQTAPS